MDIVIDTNTFTPIQDKKHAIHSEFAPILAGIEHGSLSVVWGGDHYKRELEKTPQTLSWFKQLRHINKLRIVDHADVNRHEEIIKVNTPSDFDDPHLVAIVIVSRAKIIVTNDKRACPHLTRRSLYPKGIRKPKIYQGLRHVPLLPPIPRHPA